MRRDSHKTAQIMENFSKPSKQPKDKPTLKVGLSPWVGDNPYILVLGTLPGDDSIETGSYYANPHNRFWEIMHCLFNGNIEDKSKEFITSHHIALWDCLESAQRVGSADKDIIRETEKPNDLLAFLLNYPTIKTIIINGTSKHSKTGYSTLQVFKKYFGKLYMDNNYNIIPLYQTSKSNERYGITIEMKKKAWLIVREIIDAKTKIYQD